MVIAGEVDSRLIREPGGVDATLDNLGNACGMAACHTMSPTDSPLVQIAPDVGLQAGSACDGSGGSAVTLSKPWPSAPWTSSMKWTLVTNPHRAEGR